MLGLADGRDLHEVSLFDLDASALIVAVVEAVSGRLREVRSSVTTLVHDFDILS